MGLIDAASFQARARTIDHLGRGQIADAPTAISELWKNAYDAYAQNVALHIFDGAPATAAVFDDGVGMDLDDIVGRWLVIGTESKIEESAEARHPFFGLPFRPRQGEKGIGRLSAAFLAPATLLVSKKMSGRFVSVLVDWRLFENPFIALSEIQLPVYSCEKAEEILDALPGMASELLKNLGPAEPDTSLLSAAWSRFSEYELSTSLPSSVKSIRATWESTVLAPRHFADWPTAAGIVEHGTAMFLIGINHELSVWVRPEETGDEISAVKHNLLETLTGFTDAFVEDRAIFDYEVVGHVEGEPDNKILAATDVFGLDDLRELEHFVEGAFDEKGVFTGRVVAFGQDLGQRNFVPKVPPPVTGRDRLGPFNFCIGTFEQDLRRSTYSENHHAHLLERAAKYGGVMVYRDSLRVMPYGREEADFLGIEARRGRHAGRYFWAHRRSFGRIAFTRAANPNLRDKAGREGLVDNRARRELRILVEALLIELAVTFFGTDSTYRKELLPDIMARNALAKVEAAKARTSRRKGLRSFLKENQPQIEESLRDVEHVKGLLSLARTNGDRMQATVATARFRELVGRRDGFRPPLTPSKLGDLEQPYREYRDSYGVFTDELGALGKAVAEVESEVGKLTPAETLKQNFLQQTKLLWARLREYSSRIDDGLDGVRSIWTARAAEDEKAFEQRFGHLVANKVTPAHLLPMLNVLADGRAEVEDEFSHRYLPVIGALRQLIDGIDLESAYVSAENDRSDLEEKLRNLQAVAQVGVTVEIIGHEFETLDAEVKRNLKKFSNECKSSAAFKAALTAQQSLSDRLRFLTPLKVAGYRSRELISGNQIADYIVEFFASAFKAQSIEFEATEEFRKISISDIPARIYPVFINLINNAVYWVTRDAKDTRRIKIDFKEGLAIVADSGPGVDLDDVPKLFELFFTRRASGRGVGLYLCRVNLSVAHHRIRYATPDDPHALNGANFVIEFRGVQAIA